MTETKGILAVMNQFGDYDSEKRQLVSDLVDKAKEDHWADSLSDEGVQAKAAEYMAKEVSKRWPERVRSSMWIGVRSMDRDKGLEFTVLEKKGFRFSALLGRKSAGAGVFRDVYKGKYQGRKVTASIGVGSVFKYGTKDWEPVLAVSLRF